MSAADDTLAGAPDPAELDARVAALIERGDTEGALRIVRALHPADIAAAVAHLDAPVRELVLEAFAPNEMAALLEYLDPHYRDLLLEEVPADRLAAILAVVPDDIAADAVQELTGPEAAQVVSAISPTARASIGQLVGHEPDTAAGRMTGRRLTVPGDVTVGQVVERLRAMPEAERVPTVYVTDAQGTLEGVANHRALLIADPGAPLAGVAEPVVTVAADTDQEEAARVLKQYNVPELPVVDDDGRVLGTLTADDLLDVLEEEATEDMFRLAGVHEEEDLESISRSVRYRLPWLYANLGTVLLAAWVVAVFEATLAQAAILAAFLPVVAAQGGNAGIQTVTVMVRSLALGRIAARDALRMVRHELATGLVTGLASGLAVGAIIWLWQGDAWLGGLVAVAVTGDVLIGAAAGVLIPIGLHAVDQDPALSAGIWLTTVTDVFGFLLYLGLASLVITRL